MGGMVTVKTSTGRVVMQLAANGQVGGLSPGRQFFHVAGNQPNGIRTADMPACGQLHYHLTVACSD